MAEEFFDKKGIQIYPGDLLRSFHFKGSRNKKHYLYHTVVLENGKLYMIPTSHLEPTKIGGGGKCPVSAVLTNIGSEIISGYGPEPYLSFENRPRKHV